MSKHNFSSDNMQYVVVTGGIISGVGKGITASAIGVLLKYFNQKVTAIKIDPYLNFDAGTMSPYEHGECFVLKDGGEVDLDLGSYERFLNISLTSNHNITTGKIYQKVLSAERRGEFLGKTVQVDPHITQEIQNWIEKTAHQDVGDGIPDVCIIELGGTVGDIENIPFVEALRQMRFRLGNRISFVHVSYLPKVKEVLKTKPTQHCILDVRRSLGGTPDVLCVRSEEWPKNEVIEKLERFCQVPKNRIIINNDVSNIYRVPITFYNQGLMNFFCDKMKISKNFNITKWEDIVKPFDMIYQRKSICIIGKYTKLDDSYISLIHAIKHASAVSKIYPDIKWIESSDLDNDIFPNDSWETLLNCDAAIIPGGFGIRGINGMIQATSKLRENNIPTLGICLGMQIMVIEYARNCWNMNNANSTEFDQNTEFPIVNIINKDEQIKGGTMRLGEQLTYISENSKIYDIYNKNNKKQSKNIIHERHRHRYEINTNIIDSEKEEFSGKNENNVIDIFEIKNNKFYIGCQFHPEYETKPNKPHPLFLSLIQSTI